MRLAPAAPTDVAALVADVATRFAARAHDDGVQLRVVAAAAPLPVAAPPDVLRLALHVLVDHALACTPAGGHVALVLRREQDDAVLEVQDDGPGLTRLAFRDLQSGTAAAEPSNPLTRTSLLLASFGGAFALEAEGPRQGLCRTVRLPLAPAA